MLARAPELMFALTWTPTLAHPRLSELSDAELQEARIRARVGTSSRLLTLTLTLTTLKNCSNPNSNPNPNWLGLGLVSDLALKVCPALTLLLTYHSISYTTTVIVCDCYSKG